MAYKMKGSPAKLGTIQGTSGHSSALKRRKRKESDADRLARLKADKKTQEGLEGIEGTPEYEAKAKQTNIRKGEDEYMEAQRIKQAYVRSHEDEYMAEQKALAAEEKAKGEAKTETRFDVMDALKGYLSSGNLRGAIGAGFSKKSPNEILEMQKSREAKTKKKKTNAGKSAEEISKAKIAAKIKKASDLGDIGLD